MKYNYTESYFPLKQIQVKKVRGEFQETMCTKCVSLKAWIVKEKKDSRVIKDIDGQSFQGLHV